jgi:queuine tRNA-ribosyltransferase
LTVRSLFYTREWKIQRTIGADIIMAFDECTPYPCDYTMQTLDENDAPLVRPLHQSFNTQPVKYGYDQAFFPIQGSCYKICVSNQRNIL